MSISRSTIAAIRFGYGFRPGEPPPADGDALLRQLRDGAAGSRLAIPTLAERVALLNAVRAVERDGKDDAPQDDDQDDEARVDRFIERRDAAQERLRDGYLQDAHAVFARPVISPYGFYERLAAFWGDHFSISMTKRKIMALLPDFHASAIRPHVTARFSDLLRAVVTHPAMMAYLDQLASIGPNNRRSGRTQRGLNENLAREVLELHTLGADGGYTQTDVTEFARLLTGLGAVVKTGAFRFFPARAEPGVKTVLGRRYGARGEPHTLADIYRALDDIAQAPATRRFVSTKLARHFVSDAPEAAVVEALEAAWKRTDGDLGAMARALVEHPAPWDHFGEKVKSPFDLVVSTLRAADVPAGRLGKPEERPRLNPLTLGSMRLLGQTMWRAPGPDGWPDTAEDWITPQGLAARVDWSTRAGRRLAGRTFGDAAAADDPRRFLETTLKDAARPDTTFLVSGAAERWEGFALALASPEFQRR